MHRLYRQVHTVEQLAMNTQDQFLRGTWYITRGQICWIRLYTNRIEIRAWRWGRGTLEVVPMDAVERADIVPYGWQRTRLVLRLTDGSKRVLRVSGPGLWKQTINQLRAVPFFILA